LKAYVNTRIRAGVNNDAEDILQDVALKLFSGADRYSPIDNVAAFVYHSVRNKIIDIMRQHKRSRYREESFDLQWDRFRELFDEAEPGYSDRVQEALLEHIFSLKPEYRDVILAFDFEGYSYRELAMETGIPEGTLMSRRHRAISLLYKKLESLIDRKT